MRGRQVHRTVGRKVAGNIRPAAREFFKIELALLPEKSAADRTVPRRRQAAFFSMLSWANQPAAEIIVHRFGQKAVVKIGGERRAPVAFAHLGSVLVQDERNVRVVLGLTPNA